MSTSRPSASPSKLPSITFEKHVLDNGLQLLLHVDRKLPMVHVNHWYHVGSKNEKLGRTGIAHLFEHLMFEGSKNAPEDYFAYAERAGANLREGGVNGTTNHDRTNYFATVPAENLEYLLWLESDRLATLAEVLSQKRLDTQREVVRNERRQSYENRPFGRASHIVDANLHPQGHPYSWPVIGGHEDLQAAELEEFRQFFRTYYTPNNLSLTVAGDIDPERTRRLVETYYGAIPPGPSLERMTRWMPRLHGERIVKAEEEVPQERVYLVWPAPWSFSHEEPALDVAVPLLVDGISSRLRRVLVYERELCVSVSAWQHSRELSGQFGIAATARPGRSLEEIEELVAGEIRRLGSEGVTPREVARVKARWEYFYLHAVERIGGFGGKADILNHYNLFTGDPARLDADLLRYQSLTAEVIGGAVGRWLDNRNRVVLRYRKRQPGAGRTPQVERTRVPGLSESGTFAPPKVERAVLDNGLELMVVPRPDLPKVAVALASKVGAAADPPDKQGRASLASRVVDRGTGERDALQIQELLADLGTSLGARAGRDGSVLSMEVLRRNLEPALAILGEVVAGATYPEAEVARERQRRLDALEHESTDPKTVAARVRTVLGLGAEHPYGRTASGVPETVAALTADDLRQHHARSIAGPGTTLVMVGDVGLEEAGALAGRVLGTSRGEGEAAVSLPPPSPADPKRLYVVDRPGSAQTVVCQVMPAPARNIPERHVLRLVNAVWGGTFRARLNQNLRQDKGIAYHAFSFLVSYREAGVWCAEASVETERTGDAIDEFLSELRGIAGERPITAEELDHARVNWVRGYAQKFETIVQLAGQVVDHWCADLPVEEAESALREAGSVDLAEVQSMAERFLFPERAVLLLVGDLSRIRGQVEARDLGPVTLLDAYGRRVEAS